MNNTMKKFINILAAALLGLGGVTSCTLDAVNYVEKTPENFPVTSSDASQALAGIYQNLSLVCANPQMSFFYLSMLASDDNLGGGGTNDKLMQAMDLLLNYQTDMTHQFWSDRYQGINRANALLEGVENMELEESERNQVVGEAKFMRAFFYYELASQYGRVPLVLSTEEAEPSQPAAAALWGQILMDLRDAAATMPAVRKTDGHVDKYAAEAMLGRAWLFYTGMYGNGDDLAALTSTTYNPLSEVALPDGTTLTKNEVIGYIDDCVDNSGYSLVPDYRNLWAYTNRCTVEDYNYTKGQGLKWVEDDAAVNPESMFAIKFNKLASWQTTIGYANGYALHFGMRGGQDYSKTFPFGQGWGAGPVAPNLVNDWSSAESDDMRRHNTKLNCLEYHRDSEFNLGTEDFILLLAKMDDITDGKLDTAKVKAFRAPAGTLVEVYATTLHYAPCHVDQAKGFRVLVALPQGTNTAKPEIKADGGDDAQLWACNKWLLAHVESSEAAAGAYVGLEGVNIDIADDL